MSASSAKKSDIVRSVAGLVSASTVCRSGRTCKECGGAGICEHGKNKLLCIKGLWWVCLAFVSMGGKRVLARTVLDLLSASMARTGTCAMIVEDLASVSMPSKGNFVRSAVDLLSASTVKCDTYRRSVG